MSENAENVCEEKVYNDLFLRLSSDLHSFLLYKFRDLDRLEDVMQDAFITLWKNCEKVAPAFAKSYLYKVAQNQFLKLLDKDKVRQKHLNLQTDWTDIEDPDFNLQHKELGERLKVALEDLPDSMREVFLLNRVDGKTYKEIAEMLEISVKAVEKRMHKALVKLREIIEKI